MDNTVTLVGNVTRDPELRYTTNGAANVGFRITSYNVCYTKLLRSRPPLDCSLNLGGSWVVGVSSDRVV